MSRGAQCANSMGHGGWVVMEALSRFLSEKWISKMVDSQGDIIQIFPEARITISYYKNSVLHFVAPVSLAASAIQAAPSDPIAQSRFFDFLVFLFGYEFLMPPELSTEEVFQDALEHLAAYGALSNEDGHFEVSDPERLKELACLTHCFIDLIFACPPWMSSVSVPQHHPQRASASASAVWSSPIWPSTRSAILRPFPS